MNTYLKVLVRIARDMDMSPSARKEFVTTMLAGEAELGRLIKEEYWLARGIDRREVQS